MEFFYGNKTKRKYKKKKEQNNRWIEGLEPMAPGWLSIALTTVLSCQLLFQGRVFVLSCMWIA